jgi:sigma-B regulation protein RsbU (phosphoserine phosphatase)
MSTINASSRTNAYATAFRGDVRDTRHGLGLGLHIASQIAQAHGGRIAVTSTAEETRFVFRMPLRV